MNCKKKNMINSLNTLQTLFSKEQRLQTWMDIESALAEVQADMGLIPEKAAKDIRNKSGISNIDMAEYDEMYIKVKHPLVPLLKLFQKAVGPSGEYLHIGATTHDIVDIAKIVSLKKIWDITIEVLTEIEKDLICLIEKHAGTPMAGRSHNVQALPITFGFKASIWADEINRNIERLKESERRIFVVTFSGANGTYASFSGRGQEMEAKMAEKFGLFIPDFPWHPARDRIAEMACTFALVAETFARISQEIYMLMATETGELSEGFNEGQVGSSTMPHKINPTLTQEIMGNARTLRYCASQCLECMCIDHEHNLVHFYDERITCERIGQTVCELLLQAYDLIHNLQVNEKHMLKNLDALHGCMLSEAVMLELGKHTGKMTAKDIVTELSIKAVRNELSLGSLLKNDERVNKYLSSDKIEELLRPDNYVVQAEELAVEMVKKLKKKYM